MNTSNDETKAPATTEQESFTWKEVDRQRRLEALTQLAQQAQITATPETRATTPAALPQTRRFLSGRTLLALVLVVVVLVGGAGVVYWRTHQPTPTVLGPLPPVLTVSLRANGLDCPSGMTWSPDGQTFGVFAIQQTLDCQSAGEYKRVLALFDAHTGALKQIVSPYAQLERFNVPVSWVRAVVWSRDGKRLYFLAGYALGRIDAVPVSGLLIYPLDGGAPRYVSGPAVGEGSEVVWNLYTQTAAAVIDGRLPTAASYSWTADGHLVPDTTSSSGVGPISLWQTGTIEPIYRIKDGSSDVEKPPVALVYEARTTLVSADGQFAVANVWREAGVPLSTSTKAAAFDKATCDFYKWYHLCDMPVLTPPDAGFEAVRTAAAAGYTSTYTVPGYPPVTATRTQWTSTDVVYRPDGKVLAAFLPEGIENGKNTYLTFIDSTSGSTLGTLTVPGDHATGVSFQPGIPTLAWAPSGQQLAYLYTDNYRTAWFTLWEGPSLPQTR